MRITDLGEITGSVLVYGGPYSNLQATSALMERADGLGIPPGRRICTGDVVAYGAGAAATVALVRARGGAVVAGNCERQLAEGAPDCGCGFDAGSACDLLSRGWYPHALAQTPADSRAWMADLPDAIVFYHEGRRIAVLHGGATDIARFLWPSTPDEGFRHERRVLEAETGPLDTIVAGHCGLAFRRRFDGLDWINAGVIGLPPHDGRAATRFATLDKGRVLFHRLEYDAQAARQAMEAAGLTQGYHATLTDGSWPSTDILPAEMRPPLS
ncbi:diadenosine tetraphosphatase [Brevirhabdus pacifica]|uniref:Diadenosine tetraphosphatase n=1 Tax=Brevirhabdus pacifica TaxID=1267768 RepID=A0A1U7DFQ2_9RHOB|nr:metallophosphoesterase family protein [Brevirhabdus pacifica]APX88723.1 diadenosine tetraphosphatase [Brevirhabdus pacifica]OWU79983.1 diadenosine tetraphosphatase [Loktanella sp. 22II-4b]PJJ86758.1 calcineurin-like phosphoesterase family protein [Brevirhabdus pacifica]